MSSAVLTPGTAALVLFGLGEASGAKVSVNLMIGVVVLVVSPFIAKLMHLDLLKAEAALAGDKELAEPAAAGMDTRLEQKPH